LKERKAYAEYLQKPHLYKDLIQGCQYK